MTGNYGRQVITPGENSLTPETCPLQARGVERSTQECWF